MKEMSAVVRLLETERNRLAKELHGITAALAAFTKTYAKGTTRRQLSAEARERIAAAQRKRWAKARQKPATTKVVTTRAKRTLSAAARRKIAAAQRARWAKVKAAAKKKTTG